MFISNFRLKTRLQRLTCNLAQVVDFYVLHPKRELHKVALRQTVDYIQERMGAALPLETARDVLDQVLKTERLPAGAVLEFGVFKGATIRYIAKRLPDRRVYGFDSFGGLPQAWQGNVETFDAKGRLPSVPANVALVRGLFEDSLPGWLETHREPAAFVHVDCDLYASTRTVLNALASRLQPGAVIVFDEYFGYWGWRDHEFRAFQEFVETYDVTYEYLCFARLQCAVRIVANPRFTAAG